MSRPASRPARLPLQPANSRHHGAVHGGKYVVQGCAMKGERGSGTEDRMARCSSLRGLLRARRNPALSQSISLCPDGSHFVPANPTLSRRIPPCPGGSHFVPVNPTPSWRVPLSLTAIAARAPPDPRGRRSLPAWTLPEAPRRNGSAPPHVAVRTVICEGRQRCRSPSASGSTRSHSRARAPSGAGSTSARRAGSIRSGRPTAWFRRSLSSR